jgi:hypothetical protein
MLRRPQQCGLMQRERHRITVTPINDRGHFSLTTQAAARTLPYAFANFRDNSVMY